MESQVRIVKSSSSVHRWGIVALVTSLVSNLLLINICRTYFFLLGRGPLLESLVDGRGGLWEVNRAVPFLMVFTLIMGLVAVSLNVAKRLATYSVAAAVIFSSICFVLVHFIRSSLH